MGVLDNIKRGLDSLGESRREAELERKKRLIEDMGVAKPDKFYANRYEFEKDYNKAVARAEELRRGRENALKPRSKNPFGR